MASYPTKDSDFSDWLNTFITVANGSLATSGLTAADITALQATKANFDAKLADEDRLRRAALGATEAKKLARRDANVITSARVNMVLANPNVTVTLKEQMGLTVRQKPTATPPVIPNGLSVQPFANGINRLAWKSNGNIPRTVYVVEQKVSQNGAWRMVGAVTATKFDHANQTPGRHVVYRVKAKRGQVETAASPETVAYADAAFPLEDNGVV